MLAMTASSRSDDPMTKLSPTDLMRAALIVEGVAIELGCEPGASVFDPDIAELWRLATGLRELACSTD